MELVGLMDSPFVRRVAVTAHLYGIPLGQRPLSVYQHADALAAVNAQLTAPVLVLDDGRTFIDSNCICDYFDELVQDRRTLMPSGREERAAVRQVVARANLTCEKVGQLYREWAWRPAQVRWPAAIERLHGQIDAGLGWLEQQLADAHYVGDAPTHADVMAAITLSFVRFYAEPLELRPRTLLPRLSRLAARLESKEAFLAHPLE